MDYYRGLREFVKWELAAGGPDPHMRVAQWVAESVTTDPYLRAWFAGLYVAPYVVPTAEVLFAAVPEPSRVTADPAGFTARIHKAWPGLSLRKERITAGFGPQRLADYIIGYAKWLEGGGLARLDDTANFNETFTELQNSIKFNGRYFTMKLYEVLRRTIGTPKYAFSDIRPHDGSLSRRTLAMLYPEHDPKSRASEDEANELAKKLGRQLYEEDGSKLDFFTLEVMLCNVRQAFAGGQYPGRALDSELGHFAKVKAAFPGVFFVTPKARHDIFPKLCLGEIQGWEGRRKELSRCWPDLGYTWSDFLYSYSATTDLKEPVRR